MTLRQRKFCYHYAAGLPAAKAAQTAGYAKSTAEHSPQIIATITQLSGRSQTQLVEVFKADL